MRSRVEWALRAIALAALLLLIWRAVKPPPSAAVGANTRGGLERALVDATRRPVTALAIELDSTPDAVQRDWLGAIRAAGTSIAWSGPGLTPLGIATATVAEPESRVRIAVASSDSATVTVADELGIIDTIRVGSRGASRLLRTTAGYLSVSGPGSRASIPLPPPISVRRLLVIGGAGWESKFVIATLEEAGWVVDARIHVAPGVETRQGADLPLDTARYSAVLALDAAAAANGNAIERYVNAGGGAILVGAATRVPAFARITAGIAGSRRVAGPRPGLVLGNLKSDAVVLERQGTVAFLAARRAASGRVISSGYEETWKWRMRKAAQAPAGHREWWTALVSAVAYVPPVAARDSGAVADPAPVAALAAVLGPPSELAREARRPRSWMPPGWLLFGVMISALLGEVLSRRWRGLV